MEWGLADFEITITNFVYIVWIFNVAHLCVCVRIFFCRYPGYHEPRAPYAVTKQYWHVIAARLAFVFVFQYVVYACTKFVAWLVPDRPKLLELKIKREEFLAKESLQQRGVEDIDDGDLAVVT